MRTFARMGVLLAFTVGLAGALSAAPADKVVMSFVVLGDARVDPSRPKLEGKALSAETLKELGHNDAEVVAIHAGDYPVTYNAVQIKQTLRDVGRLKTMDPALTYLFFTGDETMGFQPRNKDNKNRKELDDFARLLKSHSKDLQGIQLVLLPGNHETTWKVFNPQLNKAESGVDPEDTQAWRDWMTANKYDLLGGNGPKAGESMGIPGLAAAKVMDDQSRMTYSFNSKDGSVHFVIINTDTLSEVKNGLGYPMEGLFPVAWVTRDITQAQDDSRIKHIFVVAHKPVVAPSNWTDPLGVTDTMDREYVAPEIRKVLLASNKVRAWICSHAHLFNVTTLQNKLDNVAFNAQPVQILAGNAGCAPESFWTPDAIKKDPNLAGSWKQGERQEPFFGFTVVKIHASGAVTFNDWRRPLPPSEGKGADGKPLPSFHLEYKDKNSAKAHPRRQDTPIVPPAR